MQSSGHTIFKILVSMVTQFLPYRNKCPKMGVKKPDFNMWNGYGKPHEAYCDTEKKFLELKDC